MKIIRSINPCMMWPKWLQKIKSIYWKEISHSAFKIYAPFNISSINFIVCIKLNKYFKHINFTFEWHYFVCLLLVGRFCYYNIWYHHQRLFFHLCLILSWLKYYCQCVPIESIVTILSGLFSSTVFFGWGVCLLLIVSVWYHIIYQCYYIQPIREIFVHRHWATMS